MERAGSGGASAYPGQKALKREMEETVRGVFSGRLPDSAMLRVLALWTLYQRGPYSPFSNKPFSCAVAAYSRLGLHMSAIRLVLAFPQVRRGGARELPAFLAGRRDQPLAIVTQRARAASSCASCSAE